MLVVEEIKTKTEEKLNNDLKVAEQILKPNKKSLAWTEERKKQQALRIAELRGKGKTYTGKKLKETKKLDNDKIDESEMTNSDTSPQGGDPGVSSKSESEEKQDGVSVTVVIVILFVAAILGIIIFFKDGIIKLISGEKNDER